MRSLIYAITAVTAVLAAAYWAIGRFPDTLLQTMWWRA